MGNTLSNSNNDNTKYEMIEKIAIDYATSVNLQNISMISTSSEEYKNYCDNLNFVSSDILKSSLKPVEIKLLEERVKKGVNKNTNIISISNEDIEKSKILNQEGIDDACNSITTFYIKIAHLYAAIVRVLQPSVTYNDGNNVVTKDLLEAIKEKLPKDIKLKDEHISLCSRRISFLNTTNKGISEIENMNNGEQFQLNNSICNINLRNNNNTIGPLKTLGGEYGIYELEQLYYDKNKHGGLRVPNKDSANFEEYKKTLIDLYKIFSLDSKHKMDIFTSKSDEEKMKIIGNIRFADIPLKDYTKLCNNYDDNPSEINDNNKQYNTSIGDGDSDKSKSTKAYIDNLKNMHKQKEEQIQEILKILNYVFQVNNNSVIINPSLTQESLDETIKKSREMIKKLYINCELKYLAGIEQYKQIKNYIKTSNLGPKQEYSIDKEINFSE